MVKGYSNYETSFDFFRYNIIRKENEKMRKISFNGANFFARTSGFALLSDNWSIGDNSTNDYFRDPDTFEDRFNELVATIKQLGFDYMDLWTANLNWKWATDRHLEIANKVLRDYQVEVLSYVGDFGGTEEEFMNACRLVKALGFDLMCGGSCFYFKNKEKAVEILRREQVRFALENHPHAATAEDCLRTISGTPNDLVGVTVDTGWFMMYDIAPDKAVEVLLDHVMNVHLKDMKINPGSHVTCAYGEGIVPLRECVRILEENGYEGHYSIEHEPYNFDPSEDVVKSKAILTNWLEEFSS